MTRPTDPDDALALANRDTAFIADPHPGEPTLEDDPEFQPVHRERMHWLTALLLGLLIWAAGFLVGVLTDRSAVALLGG